MNPTPSFLRSVISALCVIISVPTLLAGGKQPFPPPGYRVIQGDILVPESYPPGGPRAKGTPIGDPDLLWEGGLVPFAFDGNVDPINQARMVSAMAEWSRVANVTFVPHTTQLNWLHIVDSFANGSAVGRLPFPGPQLVHITSWEFHFVICHELGHALGLYHEQGRPDRDDFVRIEWDNIGLIDRPQFDKETTAKKYGPYDFDSVMHYHQCAFSTCGPQNCADNPTAGCRTITVLPPNNTQWQSAIGLREHLSFWDQRIMSFLYPETNWRFVDATAAPFGFGSFYSPFTMLSMALSDVPAGGTLWLLEPGGYLAPTTITKRVTLRAPLGGAVLTR